MSFGTVSLHKQRTYLTVSGKRYLLHGCLKLVPNSEPEFGLKSLANVTFRYKKVQRFWISVQLMLFSAFLAYNYEIDVQG